MTINRAPIFKAVKSIRGGQSFTISEVQLLDAAIDEALASLALASLALDQVAANAAVDGPGVVGMAKRPGLQNEAAFFDYLRANAPLGPDLSQNEVTGCLAICTACAEARWPISWTAYALATAYHETAGTMQPIREYGRGRGRKYGSPGKHGQVAYGRGYVQLTWDYNYEKADRELGLGGALIADYDLALVHDVAAKIMVGGMAEGWFTTKKLSDYLPSSGLATHTQFKGARKIINGTDKDTLIANHAVQFQKALQAGEWA